MKKISTKKQLFYSIVYYPEPVNSDINWAEIKNAIGTNYRKQTVYETAKFLLDNPNFGKGNKVIEKIRKCYYCFDIGSQDKKLYFSEKHRAKKTKMPRELLHLRLH